MGIQNLLRFLKPFIEPIHIKKYSGKRVGIDAYSWLHKGAYACSMEICLNKQGEAARRYLRYFMHHVNLLRHHNITPVVVFDGGNILSKSATEDARRRKRHENLTLAKERLKEGNVTAAVEFFQKAVSISPNMAYQVIQILRAENVEFIVAPYEADAQLAYLSSIEAQDGGIAAVITEDSDLIAYGCQTIIFKMDRYGNGQEIIMDRVLGSSKDGISFQHLNKELITGMCILAGCDLLPSVPGIGVKRAYTYVSKYKNLDRVLSVLRIEKGSLVPEDYCDSFQKTMAIFHHARIYDAASRTIKPMKPLPDALLQALHGELDFLGPELLPSIAAAVAEGRLNPITMEAFDHSAGTKSQSSPIAVQAFNGLGLGMLETVSTGESCFTIFSAKEDKEEKITVAQETCLDNKYTNEALALRKLVTPSACNHKPENITVRDELPNNNPFKKRKLEDGSSLEMVSVCAQVPVLTDEERIDECVSASPKSSLQAMESKHTRRLTVRKEETRLNAKKRCKIMGRVKNTILDFFTRM